MKKLVAIFTVLAVVDSPTLGATVTFYPPVHTIETTAPDYDPVVEFDLIISSTDSLASFHSVDVFVGSNGGLDFVSFEINPDLNPPPLFQGVFGAWENFYDDGIYFGFIETPTGYAAPLLLGRLKVDATGLDHGAYEIVIDTEFDGWRSGIAFGEDTESLFGSGTINIAPEPATVSLLGLAAFALIRRRGIRLRPRGR